jgi:hypothetical protein
MDVTGIGTGVRRVRRRLRCARVGHMWVTVAGSEGPFDFCRRCRRQQPLPQRAAEGAAEPAA